jgi:glycosyltransferase involved in cell wall biosynthesis
MEAELVQDFCFYPHQAKTITDRLTDANPSSISHFLIADPPEPLPVAAQYVATFLKPEMLHIYRQIRALAAFRPVVICQKREGVTDFPMDGVLVVPKPRTHALRRLWQKQLLRRPITIYRSEARRLARVLEESGARVLHVYFGHIGVHLLPLLEISPVPVIVSFHGADAQLASQGAVYAERARRVLELATLVLARSDSLLARIAEFGCDARKLRLHRTGVPLTEIAYAPRVPPPDGAWRLLQACRLIEKKGLRTTLRAFAEFASAYPLSTLTIAGEGPMRGEIEAMARKLGLGERVRFTGFVSQAELRRLFAESHFFVHPSETAGEGDQEGVPNSMLEAMASGLPVVATHHGGIPEAVEHGHSGWLVAERDDAALAEALRRLASDSALCAELGRAASERVRAQFDLEAQSRVLEGLYREAISLHPHAGKEGKLT